MTTATAIFLLQSAMAHGGKREGSGRKKVGAKTVRRQFSIDLDVDAVLSKAFNRSRSVNNALRQYFGIETKEAKSKQTKRSGPRSAKD